MSYESAAEEGNAIQAETAKETRVLRESMRADGIPTRDITQGPACTNARKSRRQKRLATVDPCRRIPGRGAVRSIHWDCTCCRSYAERSQFPQVDGRAVRRAGLPPHRALRNER